MIDKVTIAFTNGPAMAEFYRRVFGATLAEKKAYGTTLYAGSLGGMELVLCPRAIAGVVAETNTIQLRFVVADVAAAVKAAQANGGTLISPAAFRDPDGNSIEVIGK